MDCCGFQLSISSKMDYLVINLSSLIIPLLFSFHPKLGFYKEWKYALPAIGITLIPFVIWDIIFTYYEIWGFNENYLLGIYVFNLPIEELLFFVCIPYACLFTYHCFKVLKPEKNYDNWRKFGVFFLIVICTVSILFFADKWYTFLTSILLLICIIVFNSNKPEWLGKFFSVYIIILIPFFIVNGLLTGTFYDLPIVWYDDLENTSFRLLTIPIEDVFYGLLLLLTNVFLYEKFKSKKNTRISV